MILPLLLAASISTDVCGFDEHKPFILPPELEGAVSFWQAVYVDYDNNHVVLHDKDNLNLVWRVVPASDSAAVKREMHKLEVRLKRLEHHSARDAEDHRLLRLAGKSMKGASKRIRAQRGIADRFDAALITYYDLRAELEFVFRSEGLPTGLSALPFVESTFNTKAKSSVGAVGMWQLMPDTARELGLKVDKQIDERLDVRKATKAAARLLKQNYDALGSWELAITAYNHGLGGMKAAQRKYGNNLAAIIKHYESPSWGFASRNFYVEFWAALDLATEYVGNDHCE
jgi:membrane-bound lytic murein transglycosylase D